jgi:hypothetical protein
LSLELNFWEVWLKKKKGEYENKQLTKSGDQYITKSHMPLLDRSAKLPQLLLRVICQNATFLWYSNSTSKNMTPRSTYTSVQWSMYEIVFAVLFVKRKKERPVTKKWKHISRVQSSV